VNEKVTETRENFLVF